DLHAGVVEPANAVGNPVDLAGDLLGRIAHLARREIASVARDLRDELCLANLCSGERASVRDHALGERAQLDECLVRLVRREETHGTYDRAAVSVGQRLREDRAARRELRIERAPGPALGIFLWSRAAIWVAAVFSFLWFEPNRHPAAARWDSPLLHELGYATDVWARWDSVFFLRIAEHGYDTSSAAFGPLYPALIWLVGHVFFGQYVVAGIV